MKSLNFRKGIGLFIGLLNVSCVLFIFTTPYLILRGDDPGSAPTWWPSASPSSFIMHVLLGTSASTALLLAAYYFATDKHEQSATRIFGFVSSVVGYLFVTVWAISIFGIGVKQ